MVKDNVNNIRDVIPLCKIEPFVNSEVAAFLLRVFVFLFSNQVFPLATEEVAPIQLLIYSTSLPSFPPEPAAHAARLFTPTCHSRLRGNQGGIFMMKHFLVLFYCFTWLFNALTYTTFMILHWACSGHQQVVVVVELNLNIQNHPKKQWLNFHKPRNTVQCICFYVKLVQEILSFFFWQDQFCVHLRGFVFYWVRQLWSSKHSLNCLLQSRT